LRKKAQRSAVAKREIVPLRVGHVNVLGLTFKEVCPDLRYSKVIDIMVNTAAAEHALTPGPIANATKRICMVSHSFYESDNRIIRYAEALAERGDEVEVVALRRSAQLPKRELVNGVLVHRLQDRFGKNEDSLWSYLWPLLRFVIVSAKWLYTHGRVRKFELVHVHNIPDFLIFSGYPAKWRGARLILDIHDIVPELFATKFRAPPQSLLVRSLKWVEKISAGVSDHVILANHIWLERYTARSAPAQKCSVFMNHVDRQIFQPQARATRSGGPLILYPGGLQWHQGLDIAIRAFATLKRKLPDARFHIYGDGSSKCQLMKLAEELGLNESVTFFDPLSLRAIARVVADADLGVEPKRADSFGNEAYSTKIMEFMSVGVPVVVSGTRVHRYYFDETVVRFFEPDNDTELAQAMYEVLTDSQLRESMVRNATEYAARHSWGRHKSGYLQLVDTLIARQSGSKERMRLV
jgi:glycosyltransferase involved in cell wall biosynthesis